MIHTYIIEEEGDRERGKRQGNALLLEHVCIVHLVEEEDGRERGKRQGN